MNENIYNFYHIYPKQRKLITQLEKKKSVSQSFYIYVVKEGQQSRPTSRTAGLGGGVSLGVVSSMLLLSLGGWGEGNITTTGWKL